MKNLINSFVAYFGFSPVFQLANFRKAEASFAELISLEQQAISFVQNSLKVINNAVRSELKRNGYNPEDILEGKIKLNATPTESKKDARFKSQIYSVNGYAILRVNWNRMVHIEQIRRNRLHHKKEMKAEPPELLKKSFI
jgi:hypothetical protein